MYYLISIMCEPEPEPGHMQFKGAYWIIHIAIAILDFSLLLPIKLSLFQLLRSYTLLKAIAKRKGKIIALSRS